MNPAVSLDPLRALAISASVNDNDLPAFTSSAHDDCVKVFSGLRSPDSSRVHDSDTGRRITSIGIVAAERPEGISQREGYAGVIDSFDERFAYAGIIARKLLASNRN